MAKNTRGTQQKGNASNGEKSAGSAEEQVLVVPDHGEAIRSGLIQARAYSLWEQAGKPDGDTARERFWGVAEKEIMVSQY